MTSWPSGLSLPERTEADLILFTLSYSVGLQAPTPTCLCPQGGEPGARSRGCHHSGHQSFEFFFGGGGGVGGTESSVASAGFALCRVTLNSLPPGPRDGRIPPPSLLWRQIFEVKLIASAEMGNLKHFSSWPGNPHTGWARGWGGARKAGGLERQTLCAFV